jgi:hypothetical protein
MPLSWNNVNTHVASDVLPLADWNQAATALNSMVGTWVTTGTMTSTATNATPPFYCFFGSQVVAYSSGNGSITIPNGGFPNGLIMAQAMPVGYAGVAMAINTSSSKTALSIFAFSTNTAGTGVSVSIQTSFFIIGY